MACLAISVFECLYLRLWNQLISWKFALFNTCNIYGSCVFGILRTMQDCWAKCLQFLHHLPISFYWIRKIILRCSKSNIFIDLVFFLCKIFHLKVALYVNVKMQMLMFIEIPPSQNDTFINTYFLDTCFT